MDFNFSEDQQQLRDAVRRWVDKGYSFERRRAIVAAGGFDRSVWNELAERQLPIICLDARHANAALKMRPVKTDRNDAAGLAQIAHIQR